MLPEGLSCYQDATNLEACYQFGSERFSVVAFPHFIGLTIEIS